MHIEGVAIIPRGAECEGHWLPADEERWQAWLTDDEPPELASTAPTARRASLAATEAIGAEADLFGGIGLWRKSRGLAVQRPGRQLQV